LVHSVTYFKILESLSIAVGSLENICCVDRLFVGHCGVGPVLGAADRVICRGNLSLCVSVE